MRVLKLEHSFVWHGANYGPGAAVEVPDDFPQLDDKGLPIDARAPEDTLQGRAKVQTRTSERALVEAIAATATPTPEPPTEVKILSKRASDAAEQAPKPE